MKTRNLTASTRGIKKTQHCIRFISAGKHSGAINCEVSSLRYGVKIEPGILYGFFTDIVKFVAFFSRGIVKFVAFSCLFAQDLLILQRDMLPV
jgi:hypothetical protein